MEFAILAGIFFTFVFGVIEVARLMYVYNTLQEVTRRAASAATTVYPNDTTAISQVKQYAIFRTTPGELALAPPVTDQHIRLQYLSYNLSVIDKSQWPDDAAKNRQVCMANPEAANCIRFVQAQVCDPSTTNACVPVQSQMILPLVSLPAPLPIATTIVAVGSLGYVAGPTPPCPCS